MARTTAAALRAALVEDGVNSEAVARRLGALCDSRGMDYPEQAAAEIFDSPQRFLALLDRLPRVPLYDACCRNERHAPPSSAHVEPSRRRLDFDRGSMALATEFGPAIC